MNSVPKILIVDDDKSVLTSLLILFRHNGFEPTIENDPYKIKALLSKEDFDAVILDMNFRRGHNEGKEGIFWLDTIKALKPDLHTILFTAYGDVDLAVEAVKKGASDFILKPWNNDSLINKVKSIVKDRSVKINAGNKTFSSQLIGRSNAIQELKSLVQKVSESSVSVLVTGEVGVGKKMIAQEIHKVFSNSNEKAKIFDFTIDVEWELLEMELTSLKTNTLVLNHIELMSEEIQKSLYLELEGKKSLKVISICNHVGLLDTFNQEFLQRLNLIKVDIVPLRHRKEDIKELTTYFLKEFSTKYGRIANILSIDAINKLNKYNWPGNVKELEHTIERAVILSEKEVIEQDLIKFDHIDTNSNFNTSGSLNLSELERETIIKAIEGCDGNITKASKKLGITRTALYRRMEKYDI